MWLSARGSPVHYVGMYVHQMSIPTPDETNPTLYILYLYTCSPKSLENELPKYTIVTLHKYDNTSFFIIGLLLNSNSHSLSSCINIYIRILHYVWIIYIYVNAPVQECQHVNIQSIFSLNQVIARTPLLGMTHINPFISQFSGGQSHPSRVEITK